MDPHRVDIEGPTHVERAAETRVPARALRPAVVHPAGDAGRQGHLGMLRSVYVINRGYEDLATRLNALGAQIEYFQD
jgi:UDP-N-acetylglucosamine 1-carboxyvinyltransferase